MMDERIPAPLPDGLEKLQSATDSLISVEELIALIDKSYANTVVIAKEDITALLELIGEATFKSEFQKQYNIVAGATKRTAPISRWLATIIAQNQK